ncbi:MAG: hypothetical protein MJD61_16680, partial [Proteobacteria bacterium]|nr:hypothetical protein [Pseudomonadota bacterium]
LGKRSWKANMVVAFNKAPGDFEFHVLFYDVHDGQRRFVEELSTLVSNRKQRTFIQKLSMPRARFKPNRHMELVVVVRRVEVGRRKFGLVGEEKRRTGRVIFTDAEAR